MVTFARTLCDDIEFSPEDAGRTEPEFLYEVLETAIQAGAPTLNIPDTVGYTIPEEFGAMIAGIVKNVQGIEGVTISVHCHNDLGPRDGQRLGRHQHRRAPGRGHDQRHRRARGQHLARRGGDGARRRAARCSSLNTGIDTTQLVRTSKLVSQRTGMVVQPNKAIVGANAFAHESGIHQDGMLKNQETYEIMRPEAVGASNTLLVLGKHSGRHAFAVRLRELGHALEGEALDPAFQRFKVLADKKKRITDADLDALAASEIARGPEFFSLDAVQVTCGTNGMPTATVRLIGPDKKLITHAAVGTGPVHAVFRAIDEIVEAPSELLEYSINAVTEGIDALGHASVRVRAAQGDPRVNAQHGAGGSAIFNGHSAETDVVVASTKAYLNALNRLLAALGAHPRTSEQAPSHETSGAAE